MANVKNAKKDYMPKRFLDDFIISQYRQGLTLKSINKTIKNKTIDMEDKPLPKGYAEMIIYDYTMQNGAFSQNETRANR